MTISQTEIKSIITQANNKLHEQATNFLGYNITRSDIDRDVEKLLTNHFDSNERLLERYLETNDIEYLNEYIKCLELLTKKGHHLSRYHLAKIKILGERGVPQDFAGARVLLDEGCLLQQPLSMYLKGYHLVSGVAYDSNTQQGLDLLEFAADKYNQLSAQASLGFFYLFGDYGVQLDYRKAIYWLCLASLYNHGRACFFLSWLLKELDFDDKDFIFDLLIKAAEANYADAQYDLATLYNDQENKLTYNPDLAIHWYKKAASNNQQSALYALGLMYMHGNGLEKDTDEAICNLKKSADLGHVKSMHAVGILYENDADINSAYHYYKSASDLGDVYAKVNLALLYVKYTDDGELHKHAINLLEEAIRENHPTARDLLGQVLSHLSSQ